MESVVINERGAIGDRDHLLEVKKAVLFGCNRVFSDIEKDGGSAVLKVDFPSGEKSSDIYFLFTYKGLQGTWEGEDNCACDMLFAFVASIVAGATHLTEEAPVKKSILCTQI